MAAPSHNGDNLYEVLGVARDFPVEAIDGLRRTFAKIYHPDRGGSEPDRARMARINDACDVLSDPEKRRLYDRELDARDRKAKLAADRAARAPTEADATWAADAFRPPRAASARPGSPGGPSWADISGSLAAEPAELKFASTSLTSEVVKLYLPTPGFHGQVRVTRAGAASAARFWSVQIDPAGQLPLYVTVDLYRPGITALGPGSYQDEILLCIDTVVPTRRAECRIPIALTVPPPPSSPPSLRPSTIRWTMEKGAALPGPVSVAVINQTGTWIGPIQLQRLIGRFTVVEITSAQLGHAIKQVLVKPGQRVADLPVGKHFEQVQIQAHADLLSLTVELTIASPRPTLSRSTVRWTIGEGGTLPPPTRVTVANQVGRPGSGRVDVQRMQGQWWVIDVARIGTTGYITQILVDPIGATALPPGDYRDVASIEIQGGPAQLTLDLTVTRDYARVRAPYGTKMRRSPTRPSQPPSPPSAVRPVGRSRSRPTPPRAMRLVLLAIAVAIAVLMFRPSSSGHGVTTQVPAAPSPAVQPQVSHMQAALDRLRSVSFQCVEPAFCRAAVSGRPVPVFLEGMDQNLVAYLAAHGYYDRWSGNAPLFFGPSGDAASETQAIDPTLSTGNGGTTDGLAYESGAAIGWEYVSDNDGYSGLIPNPGVIGAMGLLPQDLVPGHVLQLIWQLMSQSGAVILTRVFSLPGAKCATDPAATACNGAHPEIADTPVYGPDAYTPPPQFPYTN